MRLPKVPHLHTVHAYRGLLLHSRRRRVATQILNPYFFDIDASEFHYLLAGTAQ
jgi:hypothetical protein